MNKLRVLDYSVDYPFIKQADSTFTNFENSTNLEKMTLNRGYKERRDGARWVSNTVDVSKFNNLKKLNFLELNSLEQTNIKNLNNLKHLSTDIHQIIFSGIDTLKICGKRLIYIYCFIEDITIQVLILNNVLQKYLLLSLI